MANEPTSLQKQSPLSEAQDAVEKARHAVAQAQSHPSDTLLGQAERALQKAERALTQADGNDNHMALRQLRDDMDAIEARMEQARRAVMAQTDAGEDAVPKL
jgi:hypothetical protein